MNIVRDKVLSVGETTRAYRVLSLKENFSWALTGNVVYAASQWGILIVLVRLASTEIVGRYTLALAITAPVILLCNLQLRVVQAADVSGRYQLGDYLGLRLVTTTLALIVVAAIALSFGYSGEATSVILAVGIMKGFESVSDILFGLMQKQERMDRIAVSQMLRGALSVMALAVLLYLTGSLFRGVLAMATVWCGLLVMFDWRNAIRLVVSSGEPKNMNSLQPRWDWRKLYALAKLGLPVGIASALISYNTAIPRYFLEAYHGEAALGIFAAIAYLPVVGSIVVEALGQSAIPRLARFYTQDQAAYKRLLFRLVGVGTILGAAGVLVASLFGSELLTLLYQPEYARQANLLVWLMIAGGIVYLCSILGVALIAAGFLKAQLLIFIPLVVIDILAAWWLIPRYSEQGAAWTLLIGAAIWFLISSAVVLYVVSKKQKVDLVGPEANLEGSAGQASVIIPFRGLVE